MSNPVNTTRQSPRRFSWESRFSWEVGNQHFHAESVNLAMPPHWGIAGTVALADVGIGDPYFLILVAEVSDKGLNGTFSLSQDASNKDQPVLFVYTKTAGDDRLVFATGSVALSIRPSGFGKGEIFAEVEGIRLLGEFSFDDTSANTNVTAKIS